jgi:hypothetical protein
MQATSMKHTKNSLLAGFLIGICIIVVGFGKQSIPVAQGWSSPTTVTGTKGGLMGGICVYKWQDTIIVLQELDGGSAKCFTMAGHSNFWREAQLIGVPHGYLLAYPATDQTGDKVFFEQGYMENDQLVMKVLVGRLTDGAAVRDATEIQWITDKKTLFEKAPPNIRLNNPGKRNYPSLGVGLINGSDYYIPYRIIGMAGHGGRGVILRNSFFQNGVFHSSDFGMTWQIEKISGFEAWLPSICKTKDYYNYFAVKNDQGDLWYSRKSVRGGSWDTPKVVTKTFCNSALYWKYIAAAEDDMIHLCWLDRRHEKMRFNLENPNRNNFEVAYCHRKDAENGWRTDAILSKGLFYSYSPSMSVEGDKIVVAWAGIETADGGHGEDGPNDIYYVTSKDSGKTWAKPLRVTDSTKDGIASGGPQVMLLKGVIHLFYIQGKRDLQQLSPGLTKLNQPPWPIYYTQRPFPD